MNSGPLDGGKKKIKMETEKFLDISENGNNILTYRLLLKGCLRQHLYIFFKRINIKVANKQSNNELQIQSQ